MNAESNLTVLGLVAPVSAVPMANYIRFEKAGDLIFLSGQGPRLPDGSIPSGTVGKDFTVEQAYGFARLTGLGMLATMKEAAGTRREKNCSRRSLMFARISRVSGG